MPESYTSGRAQQVSRKAMIAHLVERGWTPTQIAHELGVTVQAVQYHLKSLEQIWLDQILMDISRIKARKVAELAAVRRAAWHSYDLSLGDDLALVTGADEEPLELSDASTNDASSISAVLGVDGDPTNPEFVLDETTQVLMQRSEEPHPSYGPGARDLGGRMPYTDQTFQEFQAAGEARLEDYRAAQARGTIRLEPRHSVRVKRIPAKYGGEPAFLKIILDAIERESMLLGLDAPKRTVDLRLTPDSIRQLSDEELEKLITKLGGEQLLEDTTAALISSVDETRRNTGIVPEREDGRSEIDSLKGKRRVDE